MNISKTVPMAVARLKKQYSKDKMISFNFEYSEGG